MIDENGNVITEQMLHNKISILEFENYEQTQEIDRLRDSRNWYRNYSHSLSNEFGIIANVTTVTVIVIVSMAWGVYMGYLFFA